MRVNFIFDLIQMEYYTASVSNAIHSRQSCEVGCSCVGLLTKDNKINDYPP